MRSEWEQLSFFDPDATVELPYDEQPLQRLEQRGSTSLSLVELLAIVIGSGVSSEEALKTAYTLLYVFGSGDTIAAAETAELARIKGIGRTKAGQLKAAVELGRRILTPSPIDGILISSPADAVNVLMADMQGLEQEQLRVILLNSRNRVITVETIYVGSLNTAVVRVGELFKKAIRSNAAGIVVAHNHPSGDPSPSSEDIRMTRSMREAGELVNIPVFDHVIIGRNSYVSLKERGLGFD